MDTYNKIAKAISQKGYVTKGEIVIRQLGPIESFKKDQIVRYVPRNVTPYERIGLSLIEQGLVEEALDYLYVCYCCYPKDPKYVTYALYHDAFKRQFDDIPTYFDVLLNVKDKKASKINNFYLFLMSFLCELPENLREKAKTLRLSDCSQTEDKLTNCMFSQNYVLADLISKREDNGCNDVQRKLEYFLIQSVILRQRAIKKELYSHVMNDRFLKAAKLLFKEEKKHVLNPYQEKMLILLKDMASIINLGQSQPMLAAENETLTEFLKAHNYNRALKSIRRSRISHISVENDVFEHLLSTLIDQKNRIIYHELYDVYSEVLDEKDPIDIIIHFLKNESNQNSIDHYLEKIFDEQTLTEYRYVIDSSILVCRQMGDLSFQLLIDNITSILEGYRMLDINSCLNRLESLIEDGHNEAAKTYIALLESASSRGHLDIDRDALKETLSPYSKKLLEAKRSPKGQALTIAPTKKED